MLVVLFYLLNLIYVEVCNSRSFEFIDGNIQLIWPFGPRCLEFDHIVNASFTVHELSLSLSGARARVFLLSSALLLLSTRQKLLTTPQHPQP
jgi:hypothetical protein